MSKITKKPKRKSAFASKAEGLFAQALTDADIEWTYETVRIPWVPDICYYTPDFNIKGKLIEYKGYFRAKDRLLLKKVREQHPDLDIHLVFQRPNNKIHPSSSTTYKDWAEKHGFKVVTLEDIKEW